MAVPFFIERNTVAAMNLLQLAAQAYKQAVQQDDRDATVAAARKLVEAHAPLGPQWPSLADQTFRWGELALTVRALDCWGTQGGGAANIAYAKATFLSRAGRVGTAMKVAGTLPNDEPTPLAHAYLKGALAWNLGDPDLAEKCYRRAIALQPASGRSWLGIAQMNRLSPTDLKAMEHSVSAGTLEDLEDRAAMNHAIGLAKDRNGDFEAAFSFFTTARRQKQGGMAYSPAENRASAAIASSWDAREVADLQIREEDELRQPIIVTGLPRSGTTLVERILSAHPAVDGGGELGLARQMEASAGGFSPEAIRARVESGQSMEALPDLYRRLAAERLPGHGMFVDKSLNQSRSLGPYAALFPKAPLIWLRRDPLDNAWSIYKTWMTNAAMAEWSLEEIADHMMIEDSLHDHWSRELGDRLLTVPYAQLVADPARWIERITRHCGLEVDEAQRNFHENTTGVSTASAMQVREPINRKGLGTAEPYRSWLEPFITAYSAQEIEKSVH